MKIEFWALLLLAVAIAFTGCSDVEVDSDSSDAGSANAAMHREDGHMTVTITKDNFDELANSGTPLLIDFWAPWCGPCVAMTPALEELAAEYNGKIVIGKVNVDEQPELKQQFGVGPIPALFYLKDGKIVGDQLGRQSKTGLKSKINQAFGI